MTVAGGRPRILLVFGTRPEVIKLAPVAIGLREHARDLELFLCSTGQHREMLDQALDDFDLRADVDLKLMEPAQSLADFTSRALAGLDRVIDSLHPDLLVAQGDTATVAAAALVAYFHRLPFAHVEAGLRTGDLYHPFPEEGNRRIAGALAQLHFAPTPIAASRLRLEGVPAERIVVTGNTVIDALLHMRARIASAAQFDGVGRLVLLTMHRRESFGGPIEDVCLAVRDLVERNPDVRVLFPVHLSPFVREPVQRLLSNHPRVHLVEPLSYRDLVRALVECSFVLTDSGGIQEEGPALGKPVLVLRETTERPEAVTSGTAMLVGTDRSRVLEMSERLLNDEGLYHSMATATNPYGDGLAARRIVSALRQHFGLTGESLAPFTPAIASNAPRLQVGPGQTPPLEQDVGEVLTARTL